MSIPSNEGALELHWLDYSNLVNNYSTNSVVTISTFICASDSKRLQTSSEEKLNLTQNQALW